MKRDTTEFVKCCHTYQTHANLIHTHPMSLQDMSTQQLFHTQELDLISPIHPPSNGYIWILVATEYFTKWVEVIPLKKATGPAMANFIKEHILCCFGIPYKIVSDNGTPFINKDVRAIIEYYKSSIEGLPLITFKGMDKRKQPIGSCQEFLATWCLTILEVGIGFFLIHFGLKEALPKWKLAFRHFLWYMEPRPSHQWS